MKREALLEKMARAVCISQDAVCPDPTHDPCHTTTLVHVGEAVNAALTAITEAGMVVVPIEATMRMQNEAVDATGFYWTAPNETGWRKSPQMLFAAGYKAMLAAAEKGE